MHIIKSIACISIYLQTIFECKNDFIYIFSSKLLISNMFYLFNGCTTVGQTFQVLPVAM